MRTFLRRVFITLISLVVLLALCVWVFVLEDQPLTASSTPPTAEDVSAVRTFVQDIRAAGDQSLENQVVISNEAQLKSVVRLGSRFVKGFRGDVVVTPGLIWGDASVPVPWISGQKWVNVSVSVPEFVGEVSPAHVIVGKVNVPPDLAMWIGRVGANWVAGNGFGDRLVGAATSMHIDDGKIAFGLQLDEAGKNGLMRGAFESLRDDEMPAPETIENYHVLVRNAMADGRLSQEGSFLPYLQFTLNAVLADSDEASLSNNYTAAMFGLAKACGARDFAMIVGGLAFDVGTLAESLQTSCADVTFNGRIDSRRHFLTAAALQAASNRGFSVSVGEFKELYDTLASGGFDFTDISANNSGIRMSDFLMQQPIDQWPMILDRIQSENDVIITYEGIPSIMSDEEFKARYVEIDSPAYLEQLRQIEDRISALPLYEGFRVAD